MADTGRAMAAGRARGEAGFTLVEMLIALGILLIGVTTLLATLGDSIAMRRTTDARLQVAQAIDDVVVRVQQTGIRRQAAAGSDLDLELALPASIEVPGFPGLECRVTAQEAKDRPDVWLLHIQASWLDGGEVMGEEFLRVIPRQLPLSARVQRFRSENGNASR